MDNPLLRSKTLENPLMVNCNSIKLLWIYQTRLKSINYRPKIDKFIAPFSRYKGNWPYQAENDT